MNKEDKDHEAFEEYWKRKLITVEGYFPNNDHDRQMVRLVALDSFNQGIDYEIEKNFYLIGESF